MDEEAGFIAALLADPDERTVLLVYADWLDERDDPRAEYLRLLAVGNPDEGRVAELHRALDPEWIELLNYRHLRVGARVRMLAEPLSKLKGVIAGFDADRRHVIVRVILEGGPVEFDLAVWAVQLLDQQRGRAASADATASSAAGTASRPRAGA